MILLVLDDRHQAQVVGVEVDAVVAGQADGGLELARQVGRAVDRLDLVRRCCRRRPASLRRSRGRSARSRDRPGCAGRDARPVSSASACIWPRTWSCSGRGAAHDVALDVAAGGQRGELNLVDAVDRLPQVVFSTPCSCNPWRLVIRSVVVAHLVAQVDLGQQLLAGQLAAGNLGADHERVGLGRFALVTDRAAGRSGVAVVLLVGAVVLEQLDAGLAEVVVAVAAARGRCRRAGTGSSALNTSTGLSFGSSDMALR